MFIRKAIISVLSTLLIIVSSINAFGLSEAEKTFLSMYFTDAELVVVSATRSLKSITRVAENVEVVTREDIELMNAHTVADVLNRITGVQMRNDGGTGAVSMVHLQGSNPEHVAVFMDGVRINYLNSNFAESGSLPVQLVEKIEIIKGAASSVWGSSLGGVVNIITKSGGSQAGPGGTLSGSFGEQTFLDGRAEFYGKKEKTGYYLYAGRMQADGFRGTPPNNAVASSNLYLKLSQDLSSNSQLVLTTFYDKGSRGSGHPALGWLDNTNIENLYATLSLNMSAGNDIDLSLSARTLMRDWKFREGTVGSDAVYNYRSKDTGAGGSAKLTWRMQSNTVVAGLDYDETLIKTSDTMGASLRAKNNKFAFYVNDTIRLGKLTVTPGIRYDNEEMVKDFISPSLGATYELGDKSLLRATVSRGFNAPVITTMHDNPVYGYIGNPGIKSEKVWAYQVGVETGELKYLWLKASAFRYDISDAIVQEFQFDPVFSYSDLNKDKIRRQGIETEIRTLPFHHFTFSAGVAAMQTKNRLTGENITDFPKYTYDASIKYDDKKTLRGLLSGHYIWFNSTRGGSYNAWVIELNLIKKIYRQENREAELFLTGHNLFDGYQHPSHNYFNAKRWVEAGIRIKF
ncbi:MAG: hypothetical protein C0402_01170 [Thermodesulfovibrio sp.]|nr:hypothetical protein [Thermodesulfovibrio sp.]